MCFTSREYMESLICKLMDDWLHQQLVPLIATRWFTWAKEQCTGTAGLRNPEQLSDEIITRRFALDRMHYKVFNLKQVLQTGALLAERLDVSLEQQPVEKGLEKENLGIVKHWYRNQGRNGVSSVGLSLNRHQWGMSRKGHWWLWQPSGPLSQTLSDFWERLPPE